MKRTKAILRFNIFVIIFLYIVSSLSAESQFKVDNWKTHTSQLIIRDVAVDSKERIWAATSGGIFYFDNSAQSFTYYTNTEGLITNDFNTIYYHAASNSIFAGASDGTLQVFDLNKMKWLRFTEIRTAKLTNPAINDILIHNNKAYIAGGFGLTVFDIEKQVFIETAPIFGTFPTNTNTRQIQINNNKIWLATDAGIAVANLNSIIAEPTSWTNFTVVNGLPENAVRNLYFMNDTLYSATSRVVSKLEDNLFKRIKTVEYDISGLSEYNNQLVYSIQFGIFSVYGSEVSLEKRGLITGFSTLRTNIEKLFVYFHESGFDAIYNNNQTIIIPNSPSANIFRSLSISPDGTLWSATDNTFAGRGFNSLKSGVWSRFTAGNYPNIKSNGYYSVATDSKGRSMFSSWGGGFLLVENADTGIAFFHYNHQNSPFIGDNDFNVAGETSIDTKGNFWIVNYGGFTTGPILLSYDGNRNFRAYENFKNPSRRGYLRLSIDHYDTKWLGTFDGGMGLLYYNENNTPDNPNDDILGVITTSSHPNLIDNTHNTLAVDKNGWLWVGASTGLCVVINPSAIITNNSLIIRRFERTMKFLENLKINDIHIDALNNKWLATANGVWVLNSDGTTPLAHINKENSPMTTNEALSVTTDNSTGRAFIGTREGLFECLSLSIEPVQDYSINCYPQPYYPIVGSELTIDGLAPDTDIKIVTVDGDFVRSVSTTGRKALWDGRDENGNFVKSGVYLIIATSQTNNTQKASKIAVIRK